MLAHCWSRYDVKMVRIGQQSDAGRVIGIVEMIFCKDHDISQTGEGAVATGQWTILDRTPAPLARASSAGMPLHKSMREAPSLVSPRPISTCRLKYLRRRGGVQSYSDLLGAESIGTCADLMRRNVVYFHGRS